MTVSSGDPAPDPIFIDPDFLAEWRGWTGGPVFVNDGLLNALRDSSRAEAKRMLVHVILAAEAAGERATAKERRTSKVFDRVVTLENRQAARPKSGAAKKRAQRGRKAVNRPGKPGRPPKK